MSFDPNKPYNDLPLLPPKTDIERKFVLKKAIAINSASENFNKWVRLWE